MMASKLTETDRIVADTRVANILVLPANLVGAFTLPNEPAVGAAILVFFNSLLLFRCVQLLATHVALQQRTSFTEQENSRQ